MDARTQARIDQEDAQLTTVIRRYGWSLQYVGGAECSWPSCTCGASEEPPFAYTIGLFGLNHPELLIHGVSPQIASAVLTELGRRIRDGETLIPGQLLTLDTWDRRIIPETVPNAGDVVFGANRYYRRPPGASVPLLQLSYDDREGRFPWDDQCQTADVQPRPGTFTA